MQSSHETLNVVQKKQAEVGIEETVVTDDSNRVKIQVVVSDGGEAQKMEHPAKKDSSSDSSSSSESEDEAGEYRPPPLMAQNAIKEEREEKEDIKEQEHKAQTTVCVEISRGVSPVQVIVEPTQVAEVLVEANEVPKKAPEATNLMNLENQDSKEEQLKLNGESSHIDIDVSSQIICCSEVNGRRGRDTSLAILFQG